MIDIYHSRRGHYLKCYYYTRNTDIRVGNISDWIVNHAPAGIFYAKEYTDRTVQGNDIGNVAMFDESIFSIYTNDHVDGLVKGCFVRFRNQVWIVDSIQELPHKEENEFSFNLESSKVIRLRK